MNAGICFALYTFSLENGSFGVMAIYDITYFNNPRNTWGLHRIRDTQALV